MDSPLPSWKCHKVVKAAKIKSIDEGTIVFDDDSLPVWFVTQEWADRHKAKAGGYFVQYENGYESWSPGDAFESGYTKID